MNVLHGKNVFSKRKQLDLELSQMYWLIERKFKLSLDNKLLLYKTTLKPVWMYGIQLGTRPAAVTSRSSRGSKTKYCVPSLMYRTTYPMKSSNIASHWIPPRIHQYSVWYSERVLLHPNVLSNQLNVCAVNEVRILKHLLPSYLTTRPTYV